MECRAFQAFLLSNYFITKALVNVRLYYERTKAVTGVTIVTDKVTKKIDKKCRGGGMYGAAAVPVQKK